MKGNFHMPFLESLGPATAFGYSAEIKEFCIINILNFFKLNKQLVFITKLPCKMWVFVFLFQVLK